MPIDKLIKDFNILQWDRIVVSDGSGTTGKPCGWGVVVIDERKKIELLHGSLSLGTNNDAEILGVIQGLRHCYITKPTNKPFLTCHVLTDSMHAAQPAYWKKHRDLRALITFYAQEGLRIDFHHIPRNSFPLAELVHYTANGARTAAMAVLEDDPIAARRRDAGA